jgi:hypothetical protein
MRYNIAAVPHDTNYLYLSIARLMGALWQNDHSCGRGCRDPQCAKHCEACGETGVVLTRSSTGLYCADCATKEGNR